MKSLSQYVNEVKYASEEEKELHQRAQKLTKSIDKLNQQFSKTENELYNLLSDVSLLSNTQQNTITYCKDHLHKAQKEISEIVKILDNCGLN